VRGRALRHRPGDDGFPDELVLAGEPAVDGAGGQARLLDDLLDVQALVALLRPEAGGGVEQSFAQRVG
jgi:hypothetical protein